MAMTDAELLQAADELHQAARGLNHPMIPAPAKTAIRKATSIVVELAKREAKRNATGER